MPYIDRKGYRFQLQVVDLTERPHVHIRKSGKNAKYWIDRIEFFEGGKFKDHELNEIEEILRQIQAELLFKWNEELRKKSG